MHAIGRRTFLSLAAASAVPSFARTLNVIGVQLYTVRTVLPQDPLKVLRALEQIGYREAELNMDNLDRVFPALKQTSLKPVSLHLDSTLFVRGQDKGPAAHRRRQDARGGVRGLPLRSPGGPGWRGHDEKVGRDAEQSRRDVAEVRDAPVL